jgi:hypothetical protein
MLLREVCKVDLYRAPTAWRTVPSPATPIDPFFNANRPEDFETAAKLLRRAGD